MSEFEGILSSEGIKTGDQRVVPTITVALINDARMSQANMMGVHFQSDEHHELEVVMYVARRAAMMNRDGMQAITVAVADFIRECIEMKSWPDGVRPERGGEDGAEPSRPDPGSD